MDNDTEDVEPSKLRSLLEDQIGQNKALGRATRTRQRTSSWARVSRMAPEDRPVFPLKTLSQAEALEDERSQVFDAIRRPWIGRHG